MTLEAAADSKLKGLDSAWRGAEAYHFWLLAHQQLYNGQVSLMCTAQTLYTRPVARPPVMCLPPAIQPSLLLCMHQIEKP